MSGFSAYKIQSSLFKTLPLPKKVWKTQTAIIHLFTYCKQKKVATLTRLDASAFPYFQRGIRSHRGASRFIVFFSSTSVFRSWDPMYGCCFNSLLAIGYHFCVGGQWRLRKTPAQCFKLRSNKFLFQCIWGCVLTQKQRCGLVW